MFPELEAAVDLAQISKNSLTLWDENNVHQFTPDSGKKVFSVDTPPPYVSAAHLHVGHAMSYTQAEIIVRFKRMQGYEVFYPMGFDDNGLPTERHVEKVHGIKDKSHISRSDFRDLCAKETQAGAVVYENLWRSLGISVDWNLRYSTIDARCRRVGQLSFLDLYKKGLVYRSDDPVLWDTKLQTALAQADLETVERNGNLYDIAFTAEAGDPLIISTTRPELIPACVGMFFHPDDTRYQHLQGGHAITPIFGHKVPIVASEKVDKDFGTGLMMVCTFGDGEDVEKWKEHQLETRMCIGPDGKMTELAGDYAGLPVEEARAKIVKDLTACDTLKGQKKVKQNVSVGERSEQPVEFFMAPQWFISLLENKQRFRERADQIDWYPAHMKNRLFNWIDGLKYDWNISRQRYYGVPFPLWYVLDDQDNVVETILAEEKDLPVDPLETDPPQWAQEKYQGMRIVPETDVMETWMTSSVSPLINVDLHSFDEDPTQGGIYPMSMRVQAHDIIRTWLFYTLIKSEYHHQSVPWQTVMISGHGLNEQGKKISKRALEKETDANGYNRYNPDHLIEEYGADAFRYWAGGARLGQDLRFSEKEIKRGKSVTTKLWNASRMAFLYLQGFTPATDLVPYQERTLEDQWLGGELNKAVQDVTKHMQAYDYAAARATLDRFFYTTYCDTYLEMVKPRFQEDSVWHDDARQSARSALYETTRTLLSLFAPFMPFVTEELYQQANRFGEQEVSLHQTRWPEPNAHANFARMDEMDVILWAMSETRKRRSEQKIGAGTVLPSVIVQIADEKAYQTALNMPNSLAAATRAHKVCVQLLEQTDGEMVGEVVLGEAAA